MNPLRQLRILLAEATRIVQELGTTPDEHIVSEFINSHCFVVDGLRLRYSDFYGRFNEWLGEEWSRIRLSRAMPAKHRVYPGAHNCRFVGNLTWLHH